MSKVAIMVETRKHKAIKFVLHNIDQQLPREWTIQIFVCQKNQSYVKGIVSTLSTDNSRLIKVELIEQETLDMLQYSVLFYTISFWERCEGETILVFQTDTLLCPSSPFKIENFLHYNYLGGYHGKEVLPLHSEYQHVMNGGLSIRKRSFMIDCIKNKLVNYLNDQGNPCEDYFYSSCITQYPLVKEVISFSIDNGYIAPNNGELPFGLHKPWSNQGGAYPEIVKRCQEVTVLESLQGTVDV